MLSSVRITEIFYSLQGESLTAGIPTIFIRLTGCPLRCQYCDTTYAFKGGKRLYFTDILSQISKYSAKYICVTGGEPLAQPSCFLLLKELCDRGYRVSLETSGALPIAKVDPRVTIVLDVKTPDSGECSKNLYKNFAFLKPQDQIKFVICSRDDYDWSCQLIKEYELNKKAQILLSPSWDELAAPMLADWIVKDHLPVRFQLQLHKILWNNAQGR